MNQDEYDALVRKWDNFEYRTYVADPKKEDAQWKKDGKVLMMDDKFHPYLVTVHIPKVNSYYSIEFFDIKGKFLGNSGSGLMYGNQKTTWEYEVRFIKEEQMTTIQIPAVNYMYLLYSKGYFEGNGFIDDIVFYGLYSTYEKMETKMLELQMNNLKFHGTRTIIYDKVKTDTTITLEDWTNIKKSIFYTHNTMPANELFGLGLKLEGIVNEIQGEIELTGGK